MFNYRRANEKDIDVILNLNNELCIFETNSGFDYYIKDFSIIFSKK